MGDNLWVIRDRYKVSSQQNKDELSPIDSLYKKKLGKLVQVQNW